MHPTLFAVCTSASQSLHRDALVRRNNFPWASHYNLLLCQVLSLLFRQKGSEHTFPSYFHLTRLLNCISRKVLPVYYCIYSMVTSESNSTNLTQIGAKYIKTKNVSSKT